MNLWNESSIRLLIMTDVHYQSTFTAAEVGDPQFRSIFGIELVVESILDAKQRGRIDLVIILGDIIDDAQASSAAIDLLAIKDALCQTSEGIPLLVAPGNHDGNPEHVLALFEQTEGLHEIGGYRFVLFADTFLEQISCTRSSQNLERLARIADTPGGPIVALQHSPLCPDITGTYYPFMPSNRDEIVRAYSDIGVFLSLSGHYHPGQSLNLADGVLYYTAPALCRAPYAYSLITLGPGRIVNVELRSPMNRIHRGGGHPPLQTDRTRMLPEN